MSAQASSKNVISDDKFHKIDYLRTDYDPEDIVNRATVKLSEQASYENGEYKVDDLTFESPVFQATTLSEFDNGVLLINTVPVRYRTLGIHMLRQLQKDYNCILISERATAELVVLSYIHILELQRKLDHYLDEGSLTKTDARYYAILSKDLERATRQYLSELQMLKTLKLPPLKVNIKTNTAIVGEHQIIQENQNVKPI